MPDEGEQAAATAAACARRMLAGDRVSRSLGIALVSAGEGHAALSMTVRDDMLNGFGTCHGGVLYTLADTALSCACNSRNERFVAHHCSMIYLRPGEPGARLTARAVERSRAGRVGLYDVTVTDSSGAVVAEFLGHARRIGGAVIEGGIGRDDGAQAPFRA
ncbi:acyl-CoA thioesterase [Roseiarcus fermentans]|uniref:Acyl-CoA thioesterase n=1 Tax=Roseiarcus fermentans TaxID=1473586 RepID=A0A366FVI8_9HYPH|nr:hydroxyphenylacetyl-CoA thioesterase PaaI [Roseiarcus fermentans]RBP18166.1 acyl-CoA thioesterase [Roseiarcus fermentans]